jgi:hypothetical protein
MTDFERNARYSYEEKLEYLKSKGGDCLDDFCGSTPEEAIDKAYKWFHSKFSNG